MSIDPAAPSTPPNEASELETLIAAAGKSYYRKPFEKFARAGHISTTWNWAASFFGLYWMLRRDMWGYACVYLASGLVAYALMPPWLVAYFQLQIVFEPGRLELADRIYPLVFSVAAVLVFPCYANALYYRYLRRLMHAGKLDAHANTNLRRSERKGRRSDRIGVVVIVVLIAVVASVFIPVYQSRKVRALVSEVVFAADEAKVRIPRFLEAHGRMPDRASDIELDNMKKPSHLGDVQIAAGGQIRVVLNGPKLFATPDLQGKSIVLTPVVEAGKITEWRCSSDVPDGYLPAYCRKR